MDHYFVKKVLLTSHCKLYWSFSFEVCFISLSMCLVTHFYKLFVCHFFSFETVRNFLTQLNLQTGKKEGILRFLIKKKECRTECIKT